MVWAPDLIEAVERLAAPADEQAAYIRSLGTWPSMDELALEFDDSFSPLRAAESAATAPTDFVALGSLDRQLSEMSGHTNSHLWIEDALGGAEWQHVRELASAALAAPPPQHRTSPGPKQ